VPRETFPWARVMRLGLGVLQLPPEQFWRMTLKELIAAFEWPAEAVTRQRLEDLMREWPDEQ
jgi:uncharacterized phage protein (TIGR02216 family)